MMGKYVKMMTNQLQNKSNDWKEQRTVKESDMYRFLHSLKGTAGTIGLTAVQEQAEKKEASFDETGNTRLTESEWKPLLSDLQEALKEDDRDMKQPPEQVSGEVTNLIFEDETETMPMILVIHQDMAFVTSFKDDLERHGYQVMIAVTVEKGMELLDHLEPELLMLDFTMLDKIELTAFTHIKDRTIRALIPLVAVSDNLNDDHLITAYELGVHDVVEKSMDLTVWRTYIQNRIEFRRVMQNRTTIDELTGAFNRNKMEHEISKLHEGLHQNQIERYTVSMVSLDHLHLINQEYGYMAGDDVLKGFVERFKQIKNKKDVIGRYRGEFAILFPDTTEKEAIDRIEHFRKTFCETDLPSEIAQIKPTFSAGVVEVNDVNEHQKRMVDRAEQALSLARKRGGNITLKGAGDTSEAQMKDVVTLIIVDDDRVVREMLTHHFTRRKSISGRPIVVKTYTDGLSFVEGDWYEKGNQYVILLDGIMPKMDGIEALQNVRKRYGDENIVISMLTGRKGEGEVARALTLGADDYMIKPFNVKEVAIRLDRLFERLNRI